MHGLCWRSKTIHSLSFLPLMSQSTAAQSLNTMLLLPVMKTRTLVTQGVRVPVITSGLWTDWPILFDFFFFGLSEAKDMLIILMFKAGEMWGYCCLCLEGCETGEVWNHCISISRKLTPIFQTTAQSKHIPVYLSWSAFCLVFNTLRKAIFPLPGSRVKVSYMRENETARDSVINLSVPLPKKTKPHHSSRHIIFLINPLHIAPCVFIFMAFIHYISHCFTSLCLYPDFL